MKIINFGSLNIDKVYSVKHIAKPGETVFASELASFTGGKGLNQSVAAARAGAEVLHLGAIGPDGSFLEQYLLDCGVDTSKLLHTQKESGHAIIQVDENGQNSIIVFAGANGELTQTYIEKCLDEADSSDIVLLQNETNNIAYIMQEAHRKGLKIVWNTSPFPSHPENYPLNLVDAFIINELEGALLAGLEENTAPDLILDKLAELYPEKEIVITLGSEGVIAVRGKERIRQEAFPVNVVDTTAAGDTFLGYYMASTLKGYSLSECLKLSSAASAIAVSRKGAGPSIPVLDEVKTFLKALNYV